MIVMVLAEAGDRGSIVDTHARRPPVRISERVKLVNIAVGRVPLKRSFLQRVCLNNLALASIQPFGQADFAESLAEFAKKRCHYMRFFLSLPRHKGRLQGEIWIE